MSLSVKPFISHYFFLPKSNEDCYSCSHFRPDIQLLSSATSIQPSGQAILMPDRKWGAGVSQSGTHDFSCNIRYCCKFQTYPQLYFLALSTEVLGMCTGAVSENLRLSAEWQGTELQVTGKVSSGRLAQRDPGGRHRRKGAPLSLRVATPRGNTGAFQLPLEANERIGAFA